MNPAIVAASGSTIRALHARRKATTINLGIGEPTLMPDAGAFERATQWTALHGCRYSTNIGDPDLREAVAARYAYPWLDRADNVLITAGSQEAVYVAIRTLLDPAQDELLVVEPAFPVYGKIAQVEGIACRRVGIDPCAADAFDPDAILDAVGPNTRMIVICSPSNPTGRVIGRASAKRIADGLLARGGPPIYVMHDEIYREIMYVEDYGEFGKVYPHTVAVNSLSKSNALTGLRLGWAMAPLETVPQMVKMHGWVASCASTFAQRVAFDLFSRDQLGVQRSWYVAQRTKVLAAVRGVPLEIIEPDGAFYLCLRIGTSGAGETLAFAEDLIEQRDVIAIPGHIFGAVTDGWLRTSFVGPVEDVREGFERIASLAAERGLLAMPPSR